ncbi:MAG: DUF4292 domain-containing protein [Bacteroidota bacterium]
MSKGWLIIIVFVALVLQQCRVIREIQKPESPELVGMDGMVQKCTALDTIQSFVISKAEALLMFDNERYEVTVTLYSKRDSIIYLSAVNSGFEIIRASVEHDSIKVINRLNKIVYRAPLLRRFGYQYPVNFKDLENIITHYFLCDDLEFARDDMENHMVFEFDEEYVKKRISMDRNLLLMDRFEFYHQRTNKYLMGERIEEGFKIYSNFMITEFEIITRGGALSYNKEVEVKMDVNPRRYTFTEMR